MARTLLELFQNEPLVREGGRPAEEVYEIRDSKKIKWSSNNPLIQNTGIQVVNEARSRLGERTEETLVEQETTGLRVLRSSSIPVLYGTDTGRITFQSTRTKDRMLEGSVGAQTDFGLLDETVNRVEDGIDNLKVKLGFPNRAIPTYVVEQLQSSNYDLDLTQQRDNQLREIRNEAEGGILGNILNQSLAEGRPTDIGRNIVGGAIREVKSQLTDFLFGSGPRYRVGVEDSRITGRSLQGYTRESAGYYGVIGINYGAETNPFGDQLPVSNPELSVNRTLDKRGVSYSSTVNPDGEEGERNDLADKQQLAGFDELRDLRYTTPSNTVQRQSKFSTAVGVTDREVPLTREIDSDEFIYNSKGIHSLRDRLNREGILDESSDNLDDSDFVTLKFRSKPTGKLVYFRSVLSGLSETFSPTWEGNNFIGSPFSYYTYTGIERSVSFNFTVFSLSAVEHKQGWQRLNFLSSLVYPQGYNEENTAITPPIIEFTLGDMYRNKSGFISSLSFGVDDTYPWNVTDVEQLLDNTDDYDYTGNRNITGATENMDNYKLPMLIDVDIEVQFLESRNTTESKKFYSFEPQNI